MLCERCHQHEATVTYKRTINGISEEINLCRECADETGIFNSGFDNFEVPNFIGKTAFSFPFETPDLFSGNANWKISSTEKYRCRGCGQTLDDFKKTGLFGCPQCYQDFRMFIEPMLDQIQSTHIHVEKDEKDWQITNQDDEKQKKSNDINKDKTIKKSDQININNITEEDAESEVQSENSELKKLKKQLKQLVKEEKYEDAAKIRDLIHQIEKK